MIKPAPNDASTEAYDCVREEVHDAFDHVALSLSCTLPMLLAETRARGVCDDDVRLVLAVDEADLAEGVASEMPIRCGRSKAGVLYLTRDLPSVNEGASAFEAFVEMWSAGGGEVAQGMAAKRHKKSRKEGAE